VCFFEQHEKFEFCRNSTSEHVAPRNCRAVFFFLHETTTRAMASALGASAAFRPGTRAAHVFLERNPYVAWEGQRPAFAQPAFTGVVHPHLPHWGAPAKLDDGSPPGERPRVEATNAAEADHPAEPTSSSRSWLPRVARLGPMEARALPETHVQTVSASWCRDVDDARAMMRVAADAGASALLCVTGDGVRGKKSHLDALALLRAARALRDAGEIDSDVRLACAANPCLEASRLRTPRVSPSSLLAAKIEAGADAVITQPSVVPSLARAWRREIQASGLARDVTHIAGIAVPTSARSAERWHRLVFGVRSDEWLRSCEETRRSIREEADAWRAMEEHVSNLEQHDLGLAFRKRWIEERAELFAAEAVTSADFPARGAHVMPVTPAGYRSAAAVADKILKLLA
jgi:hypothetical protein